MYFVKHFNWCNCYSINFTKRKKHLTDMSVFKQKTMWNIEDFIYKSKFEA